MKRRLPILLLAAASLTLAPASFAKYITGSVTLTRQALRSTQLNSAGSETCYNAQAAVDYTCTMAIYHSISSSTAGFASGINASIPYNTYATGTYSFTLSGYGEQDNCYNAYISASGPNGIYDSHSSSQVCVIIPDPPPPPDPGCPIVIDLDGGNFRLAGIADGVNFDIDANGSVDRMGWTAAGANEGFLALDRNGNGRIDDGSELFGWATPLANGQRAGVGYAALAELDANGDGTVGPEDPAFAQLRLWIDRNHDGVSQADELVTLASAGVVRLDYAYSDSGRADQNGNAFRYKSHAWQKNAAGQVRTIDTYDVVFAH